MALSQQGFTAYHREMIDFKLYVITDRNKCAPKPLLTVVSEILDAGVKAIQLREKDLDDISLFQLAQPISQLCETYNAHLFINTNVQVAVDVGASGIHLPDNDISVNQIREKTVKDILIGCSIHSVETAKKREVEGTDFITYSPIYQTYNRPGVGIEKLNKLAKQVDGPVFALGGVTPPRVKDCLSAGATGVAVMSGIMRPTDAEKNTTEYLKMLRNRHN